MNKQNMQLPLTILVAGNSGQHALPTTISEAIKTLLTDLASFFKHNPLRVLTGTATLVEKTAIAIASEQKIPLHILMPGQLAEFAAFEDIAERWVALGISKDEALSHNANTIRDDIALAFADLVVVIGDEPQFYEDKRLAHLLISAAISRKSVLWLQSQDEVSLLDVAKIDEGVVHLLKGHQPKFDLIQSCFVEYSVNKKLLKAQLFPSCDSVHTYYVRPHLSPSDVAALANKCYWGPVKPTDKNPFTWPDNNEFNSVSQFERFDVSSTTNAKLHRGGIWGLYLCAPLAVLAAIAGEIKFLEFDKQWGVIELALLIFTVCFLILQKESDWHGRWIAERFIAEQLRYLRMGLPMLAIPKIFTESIWAIAEKKNGTKSLVLRSAEVWFLQKILRVEGLPQMKHQKGFVLTAAPDFMQYVEAVVNDQINYHSKTKTKTHKVHHCLHRLSLVFFIGTIGAVIAHWFIHSELLLFATIGLPAVAAAFYGIGTKLELTRIADQSELTRKNLEHVKRVFPRLTLQKEQKGTSKYRQNSLEIFI
jgi:hypothetical protein